MIQYQRITVSTGAHVGQPGSLPVNLVGLADATLANLPAALSAETVAQLGLQDTGFLPVTVADPSPPTDPAARWISVYQFLQRFTASERMGIEASTDPVVRDAMFVLSELPQAGPSLYLDDPNTVQFVGYMAAAGGVSGAPLLQAARPNQILA